MSATQTYIQTMKDCKLCQTTDAPHSDSENIMCQECEMHTTPAQKAEFERIMYEHKWCHGIAIKRDHLARMFQNLPVLNKEIPLLPMLRITEMLTHIATTPSKFLPTFLRIIWKCASVIEACKFINHLRIHAPKHHKMWHDFLLFAKYSPYLRQTIPDCLGDVCCVSPSNNPQITKHYLDRTTTESSYQIFNRDTTIARCSCSHQTKCETEEECISHNLPADGNCNVFDTDAVQRNYYIDYYTDDYTSSCVVTFTYDFFAKLETSYCKKFLCELRYNIWLQSTLASATEPVLKHVKEDTQRIIRETDKMRHEKTKHKNSRKPRSKRDQHSQRYGSDGNFTLV